MHKRIALVLSVVVLISSLGLPVSAQTTSGTITGQLTNGTAGGGSVADVEVRLETYLHSTPAANSTTRTLSDGSFKFENLEVSAQNSYRIALTYQEADYFGIPIVFGVGETSRSHNVTVYDSTDNVDVLRVDTAHTIIVPGKGELQFTVVYDITNDTDKAYVGTGSPLVNGKRKTLTFTVPTGAREVRYGNGLLPEYVYPSHDGFIDTMAVLPGGREVVYSYKLAHTGGTYNFKEKLNYSAAWFNLLVQGEGVKAKSDQLVDQGPLDMGQGNRYLYLVGRNFVSGQVVSATLSGLPGALNQNLIIILAAAALLLVLGGGIAYGRMRTRSRLQTVRDADDGEENNEQNLLVELARLDDEFAAGRMPKDVYVAKRAATKAHLIKVISGKRG